MSTKTYDPAQISIILGGHIATGYADGTFVKLSRNADAWSTKSGADGETARAKSNDKTGVLELTIMQTSPTNDVLSGFAIADELKNAGTFPVLVRDANGNTIATSEQGWIKKIPDVEYGKEIAERAWMIELGELVMTVGGTN